MIRVGSSRKIIQGQNKHCSALKNECHPEVIQQIHRKSIQNINGLAIKSCTTVFGTPIFAVNRRIMNDDKQRKKCRHKSNGMKTIINKRKMLLTKLQQILHGWIKKKWNIMMKSLHFVARMVSWLRSRSEITKRTTVRVNAKLTERAVGQTGAVWK